MSTFQIPPVTLLDLQIFQAKHFPLPTHARPPAEETEAYHDYEEVDEYDDGLGYYPDGVKRTLTDEQIRIFRHSEIHALRRERELREEEEAEAAERHPHKEHGQKQRADVEHKCQVQGQGRSQQPAPGRTHPENARDTGSETALFYDDDDEPAPAPKKPQGLPSGAPFAGRRIISYED